MKTSTRILGASTILASSEVIGNGCSLLRNLVLARILSKEDFGIAATLGVVAALFEFAGKMSFGQQVTRAPEADLERLQDSAQTCQVLAGIIGSMVMVLLAHPMSGWFGLEKDLNAFLLLATIPLCSGFLSLGVYRQVRELKFVPIVLTDVVPQVLITLLAWPMAVWLKDYRAILWLLIAKTLFSLIASHVLSPRQYRLDRDPASLLESLRFSWPLLVSGYLILAVFQGDRMVIGLAYSMADLGLYAVAATMAITPGLVILRITGSISTPALARAQNNPLLFRQSYQSACQVMALLATIMNVVMVLAGPTLVVLLFGQKYRDASTLVVWLTVAQSLRIIRGASISAALAKGDSVNSMMANIWRLVGLVLAVGFVYFGLSLVWVAIAGVLGEIVGLAASLTRGWRKQGTAPGDCLRPMAVMTMLTTGGVLAKLALGEAQWLVALASAVTGGILCTIAFTMVFPLLKDMAVSTHAEIRQKLWPVSL